MIYFDVTYLEQKNEIFLRKEIKQGFFRLKNGFLLSKE